MSKNDEWERKRREDRAKEVLGQKLPRTEGERTSAYLDGQRRYANILLQEARVFDDPGKGQMLAWEASRANRDRLRSMKFSNLRAKDNELHVEAEAFLLRCAVVGYDYEAKAKQKGIELPSAEAVAQARTPASEKDEGRSGGR